MLPSNRSMCTRGATNILHGNSPRLQDHTSTVAGLPCRIASSLKMLGCPADHHPVQHLLQCTVDLPEMGSMAATDELPVLRQPG